MITTKRIEKVIRARGGTAQRVEQLDEITIPDCWHVAQRMCKKGIKAEAEMVLETWHLANDLKRHIDVIRDSVKPNA